MPSIDVHNHLGRWLTGEDALRAGPADSARRGARGIKVWKNLGLTVRDGEGTLILPDDPRVVRTLTLAGELGLPVLIHVADPKAFFEPVDAHNERVDELLVNPDWSFVAPAGTDFRHRTASTASTASTAHRAATDTVTADRAPTRYRRGSGTCGSPSRWRLTSAV